MQYDVKAVIVASVRANSTEGEMWLANWAQAKSGELALLHLTQDTPLPIQNDYRTPQTLGKDRIAAAVGAWMQSAGQNTLVVDAGTCITHEWISASGAYKGGIIAPGIRMRLLAMHHYTEKLPLLEFSTADDKQRLRQIIGFNTETSMRAGAELAAAMELIGFVRQWQIENPHDKALNLILTGGDAPILAHYLTKFQIDIAFTVDADLVTRGLIGILAYNLQTMP